MYVKVTLEKKFNIQKDYHAKDEKRSSVVTNCTCLRKMM